MICLWLLISLEGIFGFVQFKKTKKATGSCKALASVSATPPNSGGVCRWLWWVYWRSRHIIGFVSMSSSFLDGTCIVVRHSLVGNDFFLSFSFFSFSFFLDLHTSHAKNQINPSIVFFFRFSPSSLICNFFYLRWLFLIEFYFSFHP